MKKKYLEAALAITTVGSFIAIVTNRIYYDITDKVLWNDTYTIGLTGIFVAAYVMLSIDRLWK